MNEWNGNDKVFRTYFKGTGKKPSEAVKGKEGHTFEEVEKERSFGAVMNSGYIDVSFDDREMYDAFMDMVEANNWNCMCLWSPKGGHSYWRCTKGYVKNGAEVPLAVGLIADIHSGSTYIPLKVNGAERFPPEWDFVNDQGDYDELPEELLPVKGAKPLWKLSDGGNRNATLFPYIQKLQSLYRLPEDVIRRILRNTNQYVFAEPLSDSEMDTILRDESFSKPTFFSDKSFLHDVFGSWLINEKHVIKINGQLSLYEGGCYTTEPRVLEKAMVDEIPFIKQHQRREVMHYIDLKAQETEVCDVKYIAFANGIYDREEKRMLPADHTMITTNMIPHDYDPDAYDEHMDKALDDLACGDKAIRAIMEECVGYTFHRNNKLRKAFMLTGGKRNGKSTFIECIKQLLGTDNISALDLSEVGDRFSTAMLFNKMANLGDDIGDDFLQGNQVAMFKKIVAGNRIKAERKGYDPFEFDPCVKMIFSANNIPRMRDKTGAVLDRLIIIPFDAYFDEKTADYNILEKLTTENALQYLIRLGMEGLDRILSRGFTESEKVQNQLKEYDKRNNPISAFIDEIDLVEDLYDHTTEEVYTKYGVFCSKNGFHNPVSKGEFIKQINRICNCMSKAVKIDGKTVKAFKEKGV